MAIFSKQKKEANFGSIFGQLAKTSGPKKGGQFLKIFGQFIQTKSRFLGQFLANLCKKKMRPLRLSPVGILSYYN